MNQFTPSSPTKQIKCYSILTPLKHLIDNKLFNLSVLKLNPKGVVRNVNPLTSYLDTVIICVALNKYLTSLNLSFLTFEMGIIVFSLYT